MKGSRLWSGPTISRRYRLARPLGLFDIPPTCSIVASDGKIHGNPVRLLQPIPELPPQL